MSAYIVHDCEHIGIERRLQGEFCGVADCRMPFTKPLAALPPSIVVDGKVALLWDLYAAFKGTGDDAMDMWTDFENLARRIAAGEPLR